MLGVSRPYWICSSVNPSCFVADVGREQAVLDLLVGEPELLGDPGGELAVGLVEHRVLVVLGGGAHGLEHHLGRGRDVPEVGGLACEPAAVLGVGLSLPPPEVGCVGGEAERLVDPGDDLLASDQVGRASGGGGVLQGVPGGSLGRVGADRDAVLHHARAYQTHAGLDAGGSRLARELHVGRGHGGGGLDGLRDDGRGRFDCVGMGLGSDVDGADVLGVHLGDPVHHVPRRLSGDGDDVLVR